jgi:hypothetical protein
MTEEGSGNDGGESARVHWIIGMCRREKEWIPACAGLAACLALGSSFTIRAPVSPKPAAFHERDWVLISQFDNRTGEAVLDGTLEYALTRELSNSRFVAVVPGERVHDALRLMRLPEDTPLNSSIARDKNILPRNGVARAHPGSAR